MPASRKPHRTPPESVDPSEALLKRLAVELAPLLDRDDVLRVAVDTTVELLNARSGAVMVPSEDWTAMQLAYARNLDDQQRGDLARVPIDAFPAVARLIRDKEPLFFERHDELTAIAPGVTRIARVVGARAALPLAVGDSFLGALVITFAEERTLTPQDRELLFAVAQQCAIALDRATLFERERSARREAQDAAAMLSDALDRMTDMHFVCDEAWRYVRINPAMRAFIRRAGYDPESLTGQSMWDAFPRLENGAMHKAMIESRNTGRAVPFSATGVYVDSRYSGYAYPVHGGTAVIVQDTTDQHRLQHSERVMAEAGVAFGASTEVRGTIVQLASRVVPALADVCVVFVRRESGSIGVMALESTTPTAREALEQFDARFPIDATPWHPIWTPLNEGRSVLVEDVSQLPGLGGSEVAREIAQLAIDTHTTSLLMVPLQARGHVLGAMGLGTAVPRRRFDQIDLSLAERIGHLAALALDNARLLAGEQQSREDAERARSAAERASQAKSDFLGMMSHELRTPLNAIAGYAELLELGLRGPVTPEQIDDLQKIRRNQRHLLGLINSVLSFVRLDAGRVLYDVTTIPLAACMGSMESLVEPQLHVKQIRYTCEEPEPHVSMRADGEKVQQILLNLLDNAIKFTSPGGEIVMKCVVTVPLVHLVVSDSGPGIDPSRAHDIFEPFVQASPDRERQQGVGLGLAISRELARGMGGDLFLRSIAGEGATFVLTIPRGADRRRGV
ncbi:MAG: GAF domain-containing sensor histidine kinase [Gemmatimonadaceae bacterium]